MIAVDSNILVYAHRAVFPRHEAAAEQLRTLAEGDVPWAIPVFCIPEFCRVVTHPRILSPPSSLEVALTAVERLLASPSIRVLKPESGFAGGFVELSRAAGATGNLAFDAQIAAVRLEHGVTEILTSDRDFERFEGLTPRYLDPPEAS